MMMFLALSPLMLMLLAARAAQVDVARTFRHTDPLSGREVECDLCPPGTYLRAACTATRGSDCAPCPRGSFTQLWNYIGKCLRCGVCGVNQVMSSPCTAASDCRCQCARGYYFMKTYHMCTRHSLCPSGHGVLTTGSPEEDTVCHVCSNNTFSDTVSAHLNCTPHRGCDAAGQQLLLRGSTWHDSVCVSCAGQPDAANYLREILPAFFLHHKLSLRRLRRVVHNLPSDNGRKLGGTMGLGASELDARVSDWVASASPPQIRQLPWVLMKTGASSVGERLQNKLQRLESSLQQLCAAHTDTQ